MVSTVGSSYKYLVSRRTLGISHGFKDRTTVYADKSLKLRGKLLLVRSARSRNDYSEFSGRYSAKAQVAVFVFVISIDMSIRSGVFHLTVFGCQTVKKPIDGFFKP